MSRHGRTVLYMYSRRAARAIRGFKMVLFTEQSEYMVQLISVLNCSRATEWPVGLLAQRSLIATIGPRFDSFLVVLHFFGILFRLISISI